MKSIKIKVTILALSALFMSVSYAEETVISIGHQKIAIPELDSFNSMIMNVNTNKQFLGLLDELTPGQEKHLAFFVDKNSRPLLSKHIVFAVPAGTESNTFSKNDFSVFLDRTKEKYKNTTQTGLTPMKSSMGVFLENDRAIGFINVYEESVNINGHLESDKRANAFIFLLLKGRILTMNIVTLFESMKDVDWLKRKALIWSAQIIDANSKSPFFK
ncbi:MAG: hypothetical protein H8D41_03645 [bacterium]|nr:hypothetical protein [Candidatus Thioglobus pontius]